MADKRTHALDPQLVPTESLRIGVDDSSFTEEKTLSLEQINETTRDGAGLQSDGTYDTPSGSNYIDTASDIHDATMKLDTQVKSVSDDTVTNANDIASLESEMDSRIKRKSVTVPSSSLLADLTSGIVLLSKVTGKIIDVLSITAKISYNTTAYTSGDPVYIQMATSNNPTFELPSGLVTDTADSTYKCNAQDDADLISGADVILISDSNLNTGDSPITLYILYREI